MYKKLIANYLLMIFVSLTSIKASSEMKIRQLELYTEQYPPYNYSGHNQNIDGVSISILERIFKGFGTTLDKSKINILPWSKSYYSVLTRKNSVLFATARTHDREKLFKWAGPLFSSSISIFTNKKTKKQEINTTIPTLLKNHLVGTIKGDIGDEILRSLGIDREIKLIRFISSEKMISQFASGKIDTVIYDENVIKWYIKHKTFMYKDEYYKLKQLKKVDYYFAFNISTSDEFVKKFQELIDKLPR